jgi:hypothetical protein
MTFEMLAKYDIPLTLLWYPRLAQDPDHLYKVQFLLRGIELNQFQTTFREIARPELIQSWAVSNIAGATDSEELRESL